MMTPDRRRAAAAFGFARPQEARGIFPVILAALGAGKAIYGAVNANQVKQRNKGYINDAYRSAQARQAVHESDVRQGGAEDLAARGLLGSGAVNTSRIRSAMSPGSLAASTTLGGRDQAETSRELGLERHDLDAAHERALNENKADAINAQIGAIAGGIGGIGQAMGASADLGAMAKMGAGAGAAADTGAGLSTLADLQGPQLTPTVGTDIGSPTISSAMGAPSSWWGGIHPTSPFEHPESNWYSGQPKATMSAGAAPNEEFHL